MKNFLVSSDNKGSLKEQAVDILMSELKVGDESVKKDEDWISEEDILKEFAV